MKFIKTFENIDDVESDLKKLLSHFITIFSSLGYDYRSYYDRHMWETEFDKNSKYSFCVKMKVDMFTKNNDIDLSIIQSLENIDQFSSLFAEYLKTIIGIKFLREEENFFSSKSGHKYFYTIKGSNIDSIINQISEKDIELKINSFKYNL